jgi:hypothetical protein
MKTIVFSIFAILGSACSSSQHDNIGTTSTKVMECSIPSAASAFDSASNSGCRPTPAVQSCEVSNGATILADGSVENGTKKCTTICPPEKFLLDCTGSGPMASAPSPDGTLTCVNAGGPTLSNEARYCCACAQ